MSFIPVLFLVIISMANTAKNSKISELLHSLNINDNKLEIRNKVIRTTPEERDSFRLFPNIFKTFDIMKNSQFKIMKPITYVTEEPIQKLVFTMRPEIVNSVSFDNVKGPNINFEYHPLNREVNCDILMEGSDQNDELVNQTEDPIQSIENIGGILEATVRNQRNKAENPSRAYLQNAFESSKSVDENEFIFLNGLRSGRNLHNNILDPTMLRLKRSNNVIEEENQSTYHCICP